MEEKEFEEKAIPLITEGFDLETDGMEFLQKLSDKNIAVISIIGPSNSGKSFLANQLSDKVNQGFEINKTNSKDSCTKGIWVWGKPIIKDNYYIIILDVQGLRVDSDENLEYSKKIFTLSTLISSIVIYNYKEDGNIEINKLNNDIIQHSYDLFNKMIQLLPKLKLEDNEELSEDQNKITKSHSLFAFFISSISLSGSKHLKTPERFSVAPLVLGLAYLSICVAPIIAIFFPFATK